ncbi:hypothetical protein DVK07_06805 [Halorubrum sp. Atlit-26R]|nr:hypothetical protein DVK07_06805 [Halorubrum sp. Atlit-26R]
MFIIRFVQYTRDTAEEASQAGADGLAAAGADGVAGGGGRRDRTATEPDVVEIRPRRSRIAASDPRPSIRALMSVRREVAV